MPPVVTDVVTDVVTVVTDVVTDDLPPDDGSQKNEYCRDHLLARRVGGRVDVAEADGRNGDHGPVQRGGVDGDRTLAAVDLTRVRPYVKLPAAMCKSVPAVDLGGARRRRLGVARELILREIGQGDAVRVRVDPRLLERFRKGRL